MTRQEADQLYESFRTSGKEAFTLHEIWLHIFYDKNGYKTFNDEKGEQNEQK